MERNKIYEDLSLIIRRAQRATAVIGLLFIVLLANYWKIQVLDHKRYLVLSEANRIREVILPAPRGLILDRNDILLAKNVASFRTFLIRENSNDFEESRKEISRLLDMDEETLDMRIEKYMSFPLFKPIVIKDNMTVEEISRVEGRKLEFPELTIETEPKRHYPFGSFAAHILGYVQELSLEDIRSGYYKDKSFGDIGGKTGIEREYESRLAGINGKVVEIRDSLGRPRGEISREKPQQGGALNLTLDYDLQRKAEELLEGREGAAVVLKAGTGEILALASYPSFNPNSFVNRFSPEEWLDLVRSPDYPLENRATRGLYAPGSIFKLTMALGALEANVITDQTKFFCGGTIQIYGNRFSCWLRDGHGEVDLTSAVRTSCNIYFYNLGRRLGIEEIARYAEILGLGRTTGVDLPGEKEGLVPHPEWKARTRNAPWYPGETISVSIGQGPLLVTPLQVAAHTALIANRGRKIFPHFVDSRAVQQGLGDSGVEETTGIKPETFEKVIRGMWESVNRDGTGRAAKVEGFDVCGKTGSTQTISAERAQQLAKLGREVKTHSWFTGFAPKDNPEIVVTVLVEFGGRGGATAAPLARRLFELSRMKYDQ